MTRFKFGLKSAVSVALAGLLLLAGVAWQSALAQGPPRSAELPPAQPAALSSTLSYYFISGDTFTPSLGSSFFVRQANDCVNQMPLTVHMVAPVHLPQASQVVSITLFSNDTVITTTFSTAYFNYSAGQGGAGALLSVDSDSGISGYQHHQNLGGSPVTIDNQNYAYEVEWRKVPQEGPADSPYLSLCGVRLAYYAPVGATFLPAIEK
jgi:hypothetical protein